MADSVEEVPLCCREAGTNAHSAPRVDSANNENSMDN